LTGQLLSYYYNTVGGSYKKNHRFFLLFMARLQRSVAEMRYINFAVFVCPHVTA